MYTLVPRLAYKEGVSGKGALCLCSEGGGGGCAPSCSGSPTIKKASVKRMCFVCVCGMGDGRVCMSWLTYSSVGFKENCQLVQLD